MNILFILPQIQKGGGQTIQALNLAEQLIRKKNNVFILSFKSKHSSREIKSFLKKIKIYCFKTEANYFTPIITPLLVNKVKNIVQNWKIDLIQSFDPHISNLLAIFLGKKLSIPVIGRIGAGHRNFYENKLLKGNFLMKMLFFTKIPSMLLIIIEYYTIKRINIMVSNSYYLLTILKQSFLLKYLRFNWQIIRNGVDINKFSPKKQVPVEISKDFDKKELILYLGRVDNFKGIDTLIQALALVKQNIPNIHLLLIGSHHLNNNYYVSLQQMVNKLNLTQNISFIDEIPHSSVPYYLVMAKILIYPSYPTSRPFFEGCPSVILEAMATKRVVISSNIGGIPEILHNNKNGLLFEPKQYSQLAELVVFIWKNPTEFKRLAENALKYIVEKHSFEVIIEKYLKLYKSLI